MTRLRLALAALLAAGLLSACQDDDPKPKVADPTQSAATSAVADPSPTTSSSPVAESMSPEETVRAWVDARSASLHNGDTSAVRALSASSCKTCSDSIDPIEEVYADGGHYETSGWIVLAAKVRSQTDTKAVVSTGIEYAAGQTVPSTGAEPVAYEAEKHIVEFRLVRDGGEWLVSFIGYLS